MTIGLLAVIFSRIDIVRVLAALGQFWISYAMASLRIGGCDADPDYGLEVAGYTLSVIQDRSAPQTSAQALLDGHVCGLLCPGWFGY
jgi:hypothetical protein